MGSVYILVRGKEETRKTFNVNKNSSDVLEEIFSKGWKLLLLAYKIISSLSEAPVMLTHLPRQVVMGKLTLPVCPLLHCLLLRISASSQIRHKIDEIFDQPSIRPWSPILPNI